jgi:hypothetical protein
MSVSRSRRRLIAWIALAAMLFGAVSPACAGLLFFGRADVLGRMLGIPAVAPPSTPEPAAAADDDDCPHEAASDAGHDGAHSGTHWNAHHGSDDESGHAAHGVFCSFCLTFGATGTVPAAGAASCTVTAGAATLIPAGDDQRSAWIFPATRHSRDPPVFS